MRETPPLVTIGLPTRNRANLLNRALKSLVSQDYSNIELIVSDNASTDHTETVCGKYVQSSFVRYHRNVVNVGPIRNAEQVLKLGRGEFFMWASDDDLWEPDYVSTLVSVLQADPNLVLVAAEVQYMLPDMTKLPFFPEGTWYYKDQKAVSQLCRLLQIARHNYGNLIYGIYRRYTLIRGDETILSRINFANEIPLFVWIAAQGGIKVYPRVLMYKTTSLQTYIQAAREYGFTPFLGDITARSEGTKGGGPTAGSEKRCCGMRESFSVRKAARFIRALLRDIASLYAYHRAALTDILRAVWCIEAGSYHIKPIVSIVIIYRIYRHLLKLIVWKIGQGMRAVQEHVIG